MTKSSENWRPGDRRRQSDPDQSMTNTKTEDVAATVAQIQALTAAGCDIIRCAVPTMEAAEALTEIKKQVSIPVVADIHLITAWRLPRSSTVLIRSASIREISEVQSVCAQWWMPQKARYSNPCRRQQWISGKRSCGKISRCDGGGDCRERPR